LKFIYATNPIKPITNTTGTIISSAPAYGNTIWFVDLFVFPPVVLFPVVLFPVVAFGVGVGVVDVAGVGVGVVSEGVGVGVAAFGVGVGVAAFGVGVGVVSEEPAPIVTLPVCVPISISSSRLLALNPEALIFVVPALAESNTLNVISKRTLSSLIVSPAALSTAKAPSLPVDSWSLYTTDPHPLPLLMFADVIFSNTSLSYSTLPIIAPIPGSIVMFLSVNVTVTSSPCFTDEEPGAILI